MACNFNCLLKSEGLLKVMAVMYTVKVVTSWFIE